MSELSEDDIESSSSSSNDEEFDGDDFEDNAGPSTRQKRSVTWKPKSSYYTNCGWPPDPSNPDKWPPWRNLRQTNPGNPHYGPRMQLFCSTRWHLALYSEKDVRGSQDEYDKYTLFELSYAGVPGHVRIQCMENKFYLAMNRRGRLYGEREIKESSVFIESLVGSYNVYLSRAYAHLGWYVAIKKSGKIKRGPKTAINQKAVQFLPRRTCIKMNFSAGDSKVAMSDVCRAIIESGYL